MRKILVLLAAVALLGAAFIGGTAMANTNGGLYLCATPGGNVVLPDEDGTCRQGEPVEVVTEAEFLPGGRLAALEAEVIALNSRVDELEELLADVERDGFDVTFPGSVKVPYGWVDADKVVGWEVSAQYKMSTNELTVYGSQFVRRGLEVGDDLFVSDLDDDGAVFVGTVDPWCGSGSSPTCVQVHP